MWVSLDKLQTKRRYDTNGMDQKERHVAIIGQTICSGLTLSARLYRINKIYSTFLSLSVFLSFLFLSFFLKNEPNTAAFAFNFCPNIIPISITHIEKAQLVCLGFEPGAAESQVQTKPLSYGGRPVFHSFLFISYLLKYIDTTRRECICKQIQFCFNAF